MSKEKQIVEATASQSPVSRATEMPFDARDPYTTSPGGVPVPDAFKDALILPTQIAKLKTEPLFEKQAAHPESFCQECRGSNPVWSAPNELWNEVMGGEGGIVCPRCFTKRVAVLVDSLRAAHARVVANESNHYDRYWTPPPAAVTDEWLDETEAKMREALTDVFCDDAAAIMLTLIQEVRRGREAALDALGRSREA